MVQFSLPYNKVGRASVLYNFIPFFFGLNILLINYYFSINVFILLSVSVSSQCAGSEVKPLT
jgi:hypothetical protein